MQRVAIEVLQCKSQSAQANQRIDVESEIHHTDRKLPTNPFKQYSRKRLGRSVSKVLVRAGQRGPVRVVSKSLGCP